MPDEHDIPMHPLVETSVDNQIEAYLTEEEEANASLPSLITMKEGWGDQASSELLPIANRAATREKFSTSHIARNPVKMPEIEIDHEDY